MLYDAYKMKPTDAQEELEEVQSDLRKREDEVSTISKDTLTYLVNALAVVRVYKICPNINFLYNPRFVIIWSILVELIVNSYA